MKFIKTDERNINAEQIVSISEDDKCYIIRMSNADCYMLDKKVYKKVIQEILKEEEVGWEKLDKKFKVPYAKVKKTEE